jgi:hypothetical protein
LGVRCHVTKVCKPLLGRSEHDWLLGSPIKWIPMAVRMLWRRRDVIKVNGMESVMNEMEILEPNKSGPTDVVEA